MLGGLVSRTLRSSSSGRGALATTRLLARSSTSDTAPPPTATTVDPITTMDFFGVHRDDVELGFGLILGLYPFVIHNLSLGDRA